jgi:multicomponent Na+:H+ antiporter subunit E
MRTFLFNVLLALAWAGLTASFSLLNLALGFVLGYAALLLVRGAVPSPGYFTKVGKVLSFVFFYLWELIQSNFRVAYDVITPTLHARPAVVAIPLDAETPAEITLLANLITMTPGTLSLDVSDDRKTLYVHAMYVDDPEVLRRSIKNGLERRVLELMR